VKSTPLDASHADLLRLDLQAESNGIFDPLLPQPANQLAQAQGPLSAANVLAGRDSFSCSNPDPRKRHHPDRLPQHSLPLLPFHWVSDVLSECLRGPTPHETKYQ
jgi:hypothetical protein